MVEKSDAYREQYETALRTLETEATEAFLQVAAQPEDGEITATIAVNEAHPDLDAGTVLQLYGELGRIIAEQTGADIDLDASL